MSPPTEEAFHAAMEWFDKNWHVGIEMHYRLYLYRSLAAAMDAYANRKPETEKREEGVMDRTEEEIASGITGAACEACKCTDSQLLLSCPAEIETRIVTALRAAREEGRIAGLEEAAKVACKSPCDFAGDVGHDCETCNYHRCLAAAVRALGKGGGPSENSPPPTEKKKGNAK